MPKEDAHFATFTASMAEWRFQPLAYLGAYMTGQFPTSSRLCTAHSEVTPGGSRKVRSCAQRCAIALARAYWSAGFPGAGLTLTKPEPQRVWHYAKNYWISNDCIRRLRTM
jgi:hypothetical protein